ncbi:MAG: DASS family sodium-coupled anion symporter, partial [Campylobacter sp.]|nr:DASS family sodium-coupled anion symporter [Campylobacter sp.]
MEEQTIDGLSPQEKTTDSLSPQTKKGIIIVAIAAVAAILLYMVLPYNTNVNKALALLLFIATLWLTEAIHITITALLVPVIAVLVGIGSGSGESFKALGLSSALSNFANPTIFLFFGGFALATALHVQKIDTKIAMKLVSFSGSKLGYAAIAICGATALLSMWVSNTATAAMMLPLALCILGGKENLNRDHGTTVFLLLGIAYSASIGGLGTLVGSPPNAIASAELGYGFFDWMKIGLPLAIILWPLMMLALYFLFKPNLSKKVNMDVDVDIPWTTNRIITIIVFAITAFLWIFSTQIKAATGIPLNDGLIAIMAAIAIVILGLASWSQISNNTEWGILMLFGGGLCLSAILKDTGASLVIGEQVAAVFGSSHPIV